MKSNISRRTFAKLSVNAAAGVTIALSLAACSKKSPTSPSGENQDAPFKLSLAESPELAAIGGATSLVIRGVPVTIFRLTDEGFVTFSRICTHQSCTTEWVPDEKRFECPCHGSSFDKNGNVLTGPASRRLTMYDTTYNATEDSLTIIL